MHTKIIDDSKDDKTLRGLLKRDEGVGLCDRVDKNVGINKWSETRIRVWFIWGKWRNSIKRKIVINNE